MQHHVYRLIATDPLQTAKINTRTSALRPKLPEAYRLRSVSIKTRSCQRKPIEFCTSSTYQ